jgi:predicted AlkP superfamily phosphohydrolase/phosphomutase
MHPATCLGLTSNQRLMVIGLDGVSRTLLLNLMAQGVMPRLARWLNGREVWKLSSTIPPLSSVAWSTIFTGVNPGVHGIFGFHDLYTHSYRSYFTTYDHIRAPSLWDHLGWKGLRSVVINVPQTYPAREIKGVMVSGFVAPDLRKATFPPRVYPYLKGTGYRTEPKTDEASHHPECLVEDCLCTFKKRAQVIFHFLENEPWDFFMVVITETDRLHHFLWHALENPAHSCHSRILRFYGEVDRFLGSIFDRCTSDTAVMLISDHGAARLKKEFYLNRWLFEKGYLTYKSSDPRGPEDMHPKSRAFALDPSRIYIHQSSRFPRGCVASGHDYEDLREEIRGGLLALRDPETDLPVIEKVHRKEEIYHGPYMDRAPDLIVSAFPGYDPKGAFYTSFLFGHNGRTGMHTIDDAFFIPGSDHPGSIPHTLEDIAPLLWSHYEERPSVIFNRTIHHIYS